MRLKETTRSRNSKSPAQVWRFRLTILALIIFAGVAALGPQTPVRPTAKAATFTVCAVGCDFTTIQAAVTAADATPENDIINVQAGTYSEIVTIPATEPDLVINGPNANIHACTGTRVGEAIVGNTQGGFQILANNVVVNGFTIQGNTNSAFLGAGVSIGANTTGVQLLNNIIQNNIVGVFAGGDSSTIQGNLIQNNNNPGASSGSGIYSDEFVAGGAITNVSIDDNCFTGNNTGAIELFPTTGSFTNITISDNVFTGNGRLAALLNVDSSSITGNTSTGATFAGSADIRIFDGVDGLSITENSLSGGVADAIRINNNIFGSPGTPATTITVNCNSITSYGGDGLELVSGAYTGTLNAENNWWGSSTGPNAPTCNPGVTGETIVDPGTQVDCTPFLTSGTDADSSAPGFQCGSVINSGGATIVTEGCSPPNGAIDPGETVTVSFCVTNNGNQPTTNLVGTLQATGGVTSPSGPQNYGMVQPSPQAGSTVCRNFTFTASGSCGGMITASIQFQDGSTDFGTVTYTFTLGVSDGMGGFVCCTPPPPCTGITCPAPITTSNDPGDCGAVVTYTAPTPSGSCGTITCSPPSGSFFPVGTTTVSCDASGTMANPDCSFTVTVVDTQPPSITCPNNVTSVTNQTCPPSSGVVTTFPPPTASDNCPGVTVACVPPSGSTFPVGTTTVTCTATDASGNTATCSFTTTAFNGCLQDEANPGNVVLFNTFTGDYRFCCEGVVIKTGRGTVNSQGCTFTITHNTADRRVLIKVSFNTKDGSASVQMPPGTIKCRITDKNITNNTCNCPSVVMVSDRNAKTNFEMIDPKDVLTRLMRIPIQAWNYKGESASVRHIGPMAQDFAAAFRVGTDDKSIHVVDANGVAFASIQGLYQLNMEKEKRIEQLDRQNAQLQKQNEELQKRLEAIEKAVQKMQKK